MHREKMVGIERRW